MKRIASDILNKNIKNTFLSCQKDTETILRKLFVESKPYSNQLKKLLIINTPNCLDENQLQFQTEIDKYSIKDMKDEKYIRLVPKLTFGEHEEIKSYIIVEFDDFFPTDNPQYRDCTISFSIICHLDYWELEDYKLRPFAIAGYIDGILNNSKLSGIGELQFIGGSQLVLNEYLGGILLRYRATHSKADDGQNINPEYPSPADL